MSATPVARAVMLWCLINIRRPNSSHHCASTAGSREEGREGGVWFITFGSSALWCGVCILTAHKYDSTTFTLQCYALCNVQTYLQKQCTNISWPVADSLKSYFLVCFSKNNQKEKLQSDWLQPTACGCVGGQPCTQVFTYTYDVMSLPAFSIPWCICYTQSARSIRLTLKWRSSTSYN